MCTLIFYKNLIFLNLTSPKVPLLEVRFSPLFFILIDRCENVIHEKLSRTPFYMDGIQYVILCVITVPVCSYLWSCSTYSHTMNITYKSVKDKYDRLHLHLTNPCRAETWSQLAPKNQERPRKKDSFLLSAISLALFLLLFGTHWRVSNCLSPFFGFHVEELGEISFIFWYPRNRTHGSRKETILSLRFVCPQESKGRYVVGCESIASH